MRNKIILLLVGLMSLLVVSGCGAETKADDTIVLRFAYASNSQPVKDAMAKFGDLLSEKTNGEVTIDYFPDAQLGSERELIELTQTGAIDITKVSGSALESFSSVYSVFGVPYLFDSEDHFFNVMENEEIMEPVYKSTEDLGFIGITYYDSGQRSFYMKDGPVNSPKDLKGKKVRVMQSETAIKMVELLGGTPTPMGSNEVYTSLQQGIIDGAENNEFVLVTAGHGGVTKYYSYDEHTRVPDIIVINTATLDRLTEEQRAAVYEAAAESTEYEKEVYKQAVEEEKKEATEKYGVVYNEVDKTPFQEAVQPLHEQFKNSEEFSDIYNAIRNLVENE